MYGSKGMCYFPSFLWQNMPEGLLILQIQRVQSFHGSRRNMWGDGIQTRGIQRKSCRMWDSKYQTKLQWKRHQWGSWQSDQTIFFIMMMLGFVIELITMLMMNPQQMISFKHLIILFSSAKSVDLKRVVWLMHRNQYIRNMRSGSTLWISIKKRWRQWY